MTEGQVVNTRARTRAHTQTHKLQVLPGSDITARLPFQCEKRKCSSFQESPDAVTAVTVTRRRIYRSRNEGEVRGGELEEL